MFKKLVFLLIFIPLIAFSQTVVYDSIGTGHTYTTISAWNLGTDNNLVSANEVRVGVLTDAASYAGGWTISGATTNASCYRMLTVDESVRHDGYPHSGAYVRQTTSTANTVSENFFHISWLEFDSNSTGYNSLKIYNCDSVFVDHCLFHNSTQWGILIDRSSRNKTDEYWITSCFMWDQFYGAVYIRSGNVHLRHISVYNSGDNDGNYGAIVNDNVGSIGLLNSIIHNSNASGSGNCCHLRTDGIGVYDNALYDEADRWVGWLNDTGWNVTNDDTAPGADAQINVTITDYFLNAASDSFHQKTDSPGVNSGQFWKYVFPGYGDVPRTDIDGTTIPTEGGLYKTDQFIVDRGADETSVSNTVAYDKKYVKPSGSSYWSAMDGGDVFTSIQTALDSVDEYGAVYVAQGRYFENITIAENKRLYGGFDGDETDPDHNSRGVNYDFMFKSVIDGISEDSLRVVDLEDNTVIDGFKIVNGKTKAGALTASGAGICAEGAISYVNIRNCSVESCRTAADTDWGSTDGAAQGGAILVDSNDGAGTCVIENCIAFACSVYCGAIEVREGSYAAARFFNCIAFNNAAFGFEISVDQWNHLPNNPGHLLRNCISMHNRCPRTDGGGLGVKDVYASTTWNTNYWSWAKDERFTDYCFATGNKWGPSYDTPSDVIYSDYAENMIFDSDVSPGVSFADTVTVSGTDRVNNYKLKGDSNCRKTGVGGELPVYMGPFIPTSAKLFIGGW